MRLHTAHLSLHQDALRGTITSGSASWNPTAGRWTTSLFLNLDRLGQTTERLMLCYVLDNGDKWAKTRYREGWKTSPPMGSDDGYVLRGQILLLPVR
jgi:hypothetical protein